MIFVIKVDLIDINVMQKFTVEDPKLICNKPKKLTTAITATIPIYSHKYSRVFKCLRVSTFKDLMGL